MKLLELQRTMARAVMQPLTFSERMQRTAPDGSAMRVYASKFIKPNDRLTSFERLEIYNRQYWFRVLSSMVEDFPGLRAVLGAARFEAMSRAYLIANPSTSFTLRDLGGRLESWLHANPKWAGKKQALALDIVKLEWAEIEAFDGKAELPLRVEDLGGAGANLKLRLQPYIRLLSVRYPVDDLLLAIKKDDDDGDFASNAFAEKRKGKKVRTVAKLQPEALALVVHRIDNSVYFRRIGHAEFLLLSALRDGRSLENAAEMAFRESDIPGEELPGLVQRWFHNWAALGWFCRPEEKAQVRARMRTSRAKAKKNSIRKRA